MRILSLIAFLFLSISIYGQEVSFFKNQFLIDGQSTDWSNQELVKDDKSGCITGVRNDDKNLYLIFQASDQRTISKILATGMSVTIKTKTKPKVNVKIDYPLEVDNSLNQGRQSAGNRKGNLMLADAEKRQRLMVERMNAMISSKQEGKFKGFNTILGKLSLSDINDIEAKLGMDANTKPLVFNYELKISFAELFDPNLSWNLTSDTELIITYTIKPMDNPANLRSGTVGSRTGRGGTAIGRRSGGGRSTGRASAGGRNNSEMFISQIVKITHALSN